MSDFTLNTLPVLSFWPRLLVLLIVGAAVVAAVVRISVGGGSWEGGGAATIRGRWWRWVVGQLNKDVQRMELGHGRVRKS